MTNKNVAKIVILSAPKAVVDAGRVSTGGMQRAVVRTLPKAVRDNGRVSTGGMLRAI